MSTTQDNTTHTDTIHQQSDPGRYLLVDDTEWRSRQDHRYTMRCWRRQGAPAIIVANPSSPGAPPPDRYSAVLANLAMRRLHGWKLGFAYYEVSRFDGLPRVFAVHFQVVGGLHALRPVLHSPSYPRADTTQLSALLGDSFSECFGS